jgi:hypothetical protein
MEVELFNVLPVSGPNNNSNSNHEVKIAKAADIFKRTL